MFVDVSLYMLMDLLLLAVHRLTAKKTYSWRILVALLSIVQPLLLYLAEFVILTCCIFCKENIARLIKQQVLLLCGAGAFHLFD